MCLNAWRVPELADRCAAVRLAQLESAAAAAVRRRDHQDVVRSPDGRAHRKAVLCWMRVPPQELTVFRTEPDHFLRRQGDNLGLAIDVDQERRRMGVLEGETLPGDRAIILLERDRPGRAPSGPARDHAATAREDNQGVFVRQRM